MTQAERAASLVDTLSASFARELARVVSDLEGSIRAWLSEGTETARISAARASILRQELRALIDQAGFSELMDQASAAATERLLQRLAGDAIAQRVAGFTTADLTRVQVLRSGFLESVVPTDLELLAPLWRTIVSGIYSGRKRQDLIADLADTMDRSEAQMATLYDTGLSVFTRQVQAVRAEPGPDAAFLYAGPVDVRLRPFCRERVGKVFSRAAIDAMDNGQLPNVFATGGGFACRHSWSAVPKESALYALKDTGERVSWIADQMPASHPFKKGRAA